MKNRLIIPWVSLLLLCLVVNNSLTGQCNSANYSTNQKDSWLSCQTSINPNNSRGNSHWLQYDLGYVYELGVTQFWNYNVANLTGRGFKQIAIDYSLDGMNWSEIGVFQLPEAIGRTDYEGVIGPDLSGYQARYVLITALSNWDDGICTGLSEVRFGVSIPSTTCGDFLVNQNIGVNPISAGIYYGETSIEADGTIEKGTDVTFKAPLTITLKAGFLVETGSQFLAKIESCETLKKRETDLNQERLAIPHFEDSPTIKIYPNPTVHLLNIDFGEIAVTDLTIINGLGHEVLRRKQNFNKIDVSQLSPGMYFINILSNHQEIITKRFIKTGLYNCLTF